MDALKSVIKATTLLAIVTMIVLVLPVCLGRDLPLGFLKCIGSAYIVTNGILCLLLKKASNMEADRFSREELCKDREFNRQQKRDNGYR